MKIVARHVEDSDVEALCRCFEGSPSRDLTFFQTLVAKHGDGSREVWVGAIEGKPVGFGSLLWVSNYPPFCQEGVAEISDLNVAPPFRRMGVASSIMKAAEGSAVDRGLVVGIGVGLHSGYGGAQRLYVRRGYVPDGRGVSHAGRFPDEGELVHNDDDLVLYFYLPTAESLAGYPAISASQERQ